MIDHSVSTQYHRGEPKKFRILIMQKHFENQDPLSHVMGKRMEGMLSISEAHGTEMPGHFSAGADAAKETALVMLLLWVALLFLPITLPQALITFSAFGLGWFAWKTGRSGWLGWARLERLHRLIEQEKYEIEHHRPQEREELHALYQAKGFQGKLLEDVVDVLMADQDRLLKVMLEEEMGLTLQAYEHPLQQCLGAAVGTMIALLVAACCFYFLPNYGMLIASGGLILLSSLFAAAYEQNRRIPAVVWNLSIAALALGVMYFLLIKGVL